MFSGRMRVINLWVSSGWARLGRAGMGGKEAYSGLCYLTEAQRSCIFLFVSMMFSSVLSQQFDEFHAFNYEAHEINSMLAYSDDE